MICFYILHASFDIVVSVHIFGCVSYFSLLPFIALSLWFSNSLHYNSGKYSILSLSLSSGLIISHLDVALPAFCFASL